MLCASREHRHEYFDDLATIDHRRNPFYRIDVPSLSALCALAVSLAFVDANRRITAIRMMNIFLNDITDDLLAFFFSFFCQRVYLPQSFVTMLHVLCICTKTRTRNGGLRIEKLGMRK